MKTPLGRPTHRPLPFGCGHTESSEQKNPCKLNFTATSEFSLPRRLVHGSHWIRNLVRACILQSGLRRTLLLLLRDFPCVPKREGGISKERDFYGLHVRLRTESSIYCSAHSINVAYSIPIPLVLGIVGRLEFITYFIHSVLPFQSELHLGYLVSLSDYLPADLQVFGFLRATGIA